jgi:hypothetical protein
MADSKSPTGLCAQRKHTSQLSAYIDNFVLVDLDRVLTLPFTASFACGLCMKSCWAGRQRQTQKDGVPARTAPARPFLPLPGSTTTRDR